MIVTPRVLHSYTNSYPCSESSPASGNFVDLSQESGKLSLLPGNPLNWLRKRHELYWSYNPRGQDANVNKLDCRYCQHCRCPKHHCAEVMFGDVCTNHVAYLLIVKMGDEASVFDLYIKATFRQTYTWLVHSKMMENGVSFPGGFQFKEWMELSACMVEGSLKTMLEEYE